MADADQKILIQQKIQSQLPQEIADVIYPKSIFIGGCGSNGTTLLRSMFGHIKILHVERK